MIPIELEFGTERMAFRVPDGTSVLTLAPVPPLRDAVAALEYGLACPIGSPPLAEIVQRRASARGSTAAVVVSDNTRPVPYGGESGILTPLLDMLRREGIRKIDVIVATGTHRAMRTEELRQMLPPAAFASDVRITNHDATDGDALRCLGRTSRGTEAQVNARYLDADLKILTGLVEPHFMAGYSGGRKSICPGLIGMEATHVFHGAAMIGHPCADSLILEGNPCHEEALEVACMAGCDFLVNVTLDRDKRITGVFCGEMEAAHAAACAMTQKANAIPVPHAFDVVVTHAGFAGINHYQAAKAACEAAKAVREKGQIILAANHTDVHPVGGLDYRRLLTTMAELGPREFEKLLHSEEWTFVPEQWEVQKWGQVMAWLGDTSHLIYCAPRLSGRVFLENGVPGTDGGIGLSDPDESRLASIMVQRAIDRCLAATPHVAMAVFADGPYGVPVMPAS